jgi:3-deoxy-D-manno-octulosonic-acid transferase
VFGPQYKKFNEAIELVECGGAMSINTALQLERVVGDLLGNAEKYNSAATASRSYVYGKQGSTAKILEFIQEKRLLTN